MESFLFSALLITAIGYLMGSLPTAYLVARTRGLNIFEIGSGNMGATNIVRAMGLAWGIAVWLLDSLKGVAAIVIATRILPEHPAAATAIAAISAILGHNWSLFAALLTGTLRGGKGAAIWFGTMLMIAPLQVILVMSLLGGVIIAATRYVSLAVLAMCALSTTWIWILISQQVMPDVYTAYALAVAVLILYRFRDNIRRLLTGTERRLGDPA
jgi:glycerol-3-phosphate acyltransferase PlsY